MGAQDARHPFPFLRPRPVSLDGLYSPHDRRRRGRRQSRESLLDPPDVRGGRAPQAGAGRRQGLRLHAGQSGDRAAPGRAGRGPPGAGQPRAPPALLHAQRGARGRPSGHPRVREAVAGRLRAATGLAYTAGHVLMTVGAGAALNTVLKALLNPGDEVLTVAPFFVEYTFYAENYR